MATVVLTVVGGLIGGPIGAALGATLGQYVDRDILFKPAAREGPRLTDLAVQTSTYGAQIPKLFGTMRVAGTVIWATDLIESRSSSSGGKGQPSVNNYSYAASFAVLLSGRPILGIGRIWAEGKLLRGAAGDFKTQTGFRLHTGGEEQPVDPLIASAEGIGLTPAHRGAAYAVFENLQLANYGNRIPSLTFEVIADPGAVGAGAIARALAGEVSGDVSLVLGGFAASGDSVRSVLDVLGRASGAWFAPSGDGLTMRDVPGPIVTVDDSGHGADERGVRRARTIAAIETVARTISVSHYDAARDYQTGLQRARRPGAGARDDAVEVPAVIGAGTAKGIAEAMLARAEAERVRRTVTLGTDAMGIAPGACVSISGEFGVWRVAEATIEQMVTKLALVPISDPAVPAIASAGRVSGAADAVIGRTIVHAFETPALDDAVLTSPRLSIVAAGEGTGWRQAALLYSLDDGASWIAAGGTAAPAVLGTVAVGAGAASDTLFDMRDAIEVTLARDDMMLGDADDAALDAGINLAIAGGELIQFGRAEPIGPARWRLSRLLRARRGSVAGFAAGDRFALIETGAVRTIDLPLTVLGRRVRVMASGVGDGDGPAEAATTIGGASVLPPTPVHLSVATMASGDALVLWTRRSRAGWRWIDGVDAPIGEEAEAYRTTITSAGGSARIVETGVAFVTISAGERGAGSVRVGVVQRGTYGDSATAAIDVPQL